ncbi:MAG: hypothetical protein KF691_01170 [Phycisphaeraceae bacterium]|nr:hypothetical protein [Phycisphaeraceae bacterium]
MVRDLLSVVCFAALATSAGAQLVLTADARALYAEAANSNQVAFPAPPYSAFDQTIDRDVNSGGGNGKARAAQNSSVSPSAMSATGSSSAQSIAGPSNCVLSQATSDFRINFHVTTPVQYTFDGMVDGAQFRLAEPIGGAVHLVQAAPGVPTPYSFSGVLRPDRNYIVLAQSSHLANACNGDSFSLEGSYSLSATFVALPPCPGDLNFDRVVNDQDFEIFLAAYNELLCPPEPLPCDADLNDDGFVNDQDFEIFLASYNELLCPE